MSKSLLRIALVSCALSGVCWLTVRDAWRAKLVKPAGAAMPVAGAGKSLAVPPRESVAQKTLVARRIAGKPHRTFAVKPASGFSALQLQRDGRMLLSCRPNLASPQVGVCLLAKSPSGDSFVETLLVDPAQSGAVGSPQGDGTWMAYAQLSAPQRILARNLATGEEREVGHIAAGTAKSPLGPVFAVDGGRVAWVDEPRNAAEPVRIRIFDLFRHTEEQIAAPPNSATIDGIALSGGELLVSRVEMDKNDAKGEIDRCRIGAAHWEKLSGSEAASMPAVAGAHAVWKRANHFSYGDIVLFDLQQGRGKPIAAAPAAAPPSSDQPSVGDVGATWLTASHAQVALYRFDTGTIQRFDDRGGRATTAGHFLAWVSDSAGERGDFQVLWSDLSAR